MSDSDAAKINSTHWGGGYVTDDMVALNSYFLWEKRDKNQYALIKSIPSIEFLDFELTKAQQILYGKAE